MVSKKNYKNKSTQQLKLLLKKKLDNGEKGQKIKELVDELNMRGSVSSRDIINSSIIRHKAYAKTTTKGLQIKIKDVNKELDDFIKSSNRLKISVRNLVN